MSLERPFHPIDLEKQAAAVFPTAEMVAKLRSEEVYGRANRNAFTLVHDHGLTAVLTVARKDAECGEHKTPEPALLVCLSGKLAVEGADNGGTLELAEGSTAVLAPEVAHRLLAVEECAYLTVIGSRHDNG